MNSEDVPGARHDNGERLARKGRDLVPAPKTVRIRSDERSEVQL